MQNHTNAKHPIVSIIIPAYNSAEYVYHAIYSALNQTTDNIEIIVVNDGSTDNTITVLERLQQKENFILLSQQNRGPGAARNKGMQAAKGEYICFLDADDRLLPTSVARRLAVLENTPHIDLIFTDILRLDNPKQPGFAFLDKNKFIEKFKPAIKSCENNIIIFNDQYFDCAMQFFPFICTSSVMIRKSMIDAVGEFQSKWKGSEDIDYWLRIAQQGCVAYINEPLAEWHHYLSSLTQFGHYAFYDDTISCYKNFKNNLGVKKYLKPVINKRLAYYAFAGGYEALAVQKLSAARKFFFQACGYQPLCFKYWLYVILTCMPKSIFYYLRHLKQKIA